MKNNTKTLNSAGFNPQKIHEKLEKLAEKKTSLEKREYKDIYADSRNDYTGGFHDGEISLARRILSEWPNEGRHEETMPIEKLAPCPNLKKDILYPIIL